MIILTGCVIACLAFIAIVITTIIAQAPKERGIEIVTLAELVQHQNNIAENKRRVKTVQKQPLYNYYSFDRGNQIGRH